MTEQLYLTAEGAARLKAELEHLRSTVRSELADRLRSAVQQGDLSENADYHKAKEDQGFIEGRIQELEHLMKNAVIVESSQLKRELVEVGVRVTVQEEGFPAEAFQLVGVKEADPRNKRISHESPIGRALVGHKEGDKVIAQTPDGEIQLTILKIE
jgi:transcription elongation factor GreA